MEDERACGLRDPAAKQGPVRDSHYHFMKTGLLTYHHVNNYGAVAQAWALARAMSQMGHAVEVVDYRPARALEAYERALYAGHPRERENRARAERLEEFLRREMVLSPGPLTTREALGVLAGRYEAVVVGSDEVWNIEGIRGWDPSYFLDFAGGARRVAYAPSMGTTATFGARRGEVARLLRAFAAVSARDAATARVVREECGVECREVVDPTLLLELSEWRALARPPKEEGFILVYANVWGEDAALIWRFAERTGRRVIALAWPLEGAENRLESGLEDWLGHFAAAEYVFSGFFHGVLMALIFEKPFTAFVKPDKVVKMTDLLAGLGLESRIVAGAEADTPLPEPVMDVQRPRALLAERVQASRQFLAEALG